MANPVNIPLGGGTGSYLVSEASDYLSRESIVVAQGSGKLPAGTILGRYTGGANIGKFGPATEGDTNGLANFGAILFEPIDATAADVNVTGHVRRLEVRRSGLAFAGAPSNNFKNAIYAAMAALMIALR